MIHSLKSSDVLIVKDKLLLIDPKCKVHFQKNDIINKRNGEMNLIRSVDKDCWEFDDHELKYVMGTKLSILKVKKVSNASRSGIYENISIFTKKKDNIDTGDLIYCFGDVWFVKKKKYSLNIDEISSGDEVELKVKKFK